MADVLDCTSRTVPGPAQPADSPDEAQVAEAVVEFNPRVNVNVSGGRGRSSRAAASPLDAGTATSDHAP
jgi:hypothetical protein